MHIQKHTLHHTEQVWTTTRRWGVGGGGLIRLAPLFHLTEHRGSRLCQTASQHSKRESANGAYMHSVTTGLYRHGEALSSTLELGEQSTARASVGFGDGFSFFFSCLQIDFKSSDFLSRHMIKSNTMHFFSPLGLQWCMWKALMWGTFCSLKWVKTLFKGLFLSCWTLEVKSLLTSTCNDWKGNGAMHRLAQRLMKFRTKAAV